MAQHITFMSTSPDMPNWPMPIYWLRPAYITVQKVQSLAGGLLCNPRLLCLTTSASTLKCISWTPGALPLDHAFPPNCNSQSPRKHEISAGKVSHQKVRRTRLNVTIPGSIRVAAVCQLQMDLASSLKHQRLEYNCGTSDDNHTWSHP